MVVFVLFNLRSFLMKTLVAVFISAIDYYLTILTNESFESNPYLSVLESIY